MNCFSSRSFLSLFLFSSCSLIPWSQSEEEKKRMTSSSWDCVFFLCLPHDIDRTALSLSFKTFSFSDERKEDRVSGEDEGEREKEEWKRGGGMKSQGILMR